MRYVLIGLLLGSSLVAGVKAWRGYRAAHQPMLTTEQAREQSTVSPSRPLTPGH